MFKLNNQPSCLKWRSKRTLTCYLFVITITLGLPIASTAKNTNQFPSKAHLPTDAKPTCVADVASWFPGGQVTQNGWVKPANSLDPVFADFQNNTRCDFYKWGAQMFLWLTSGSSTEHVFETSPEFYNVSVEENHQRTFLESDGLLRLGVHKGKTDTEIELGQAGGGDVLLSQKNSLVYYGLHANDVFALYTTGQSKKAFNKSVGWVSIEEDVACLAQYKSCASEIVGFCKGQLNTCTHNNFPSTLNQMRIVSKFAKEYGYPLTPSTQLKTKPYTSPMAIELKTSWVDASKVTNPKDYVLTQAIVPTFDRSAAKGPWTITGNNEKTLAMVGMHVVGTVNGHPEMIWNTFEHVNNVPDNTYVYTNTSDQNATQEYNSTGNWNFLPSNAPAPSSITANAKVLTDSGGSLTSCIVSVPTGQNPTCSDTAKATNPAIAPVDVIRVDPWGNDQKSPTPNKVISNNTDLVSINVSVLSQLKTGDIRGNYIQTGGIWTAEGQIPPNGIDNNLRGSLNLANTTLETFYQFEHLAPAFNPKNCFGCHGTTKAATEVSHIFNALQPLPKKK